MAKLIGNAIKFSQGKNVYVIIQYNSRRKKLEFQVTDGGQGISDSLLKLIHMSYGDVIGSDQKREDGYSLFACVQLVKLMNGTLRIQTTP